MNLSRRDLLRAAPLAALPLAARAAAQRACRAEGEPAVPRHSNTYAVYVLC